MATFKPTHEPELLGPVDLCTPAGKLNPAAVGWSRAPLHACNVTGSAPRKKKWNYWAVHDERVFFSATIADVNHYVLAFVYVLALTPQPPLPQGERGSHDTSTEVERGGHETSIEVEKGRASTTLPRFVERTAILGPASIAMPERVRESVVFEQGGRRVGLMDTPRGTRIVVEWPDFVEKGVGLTADLLCEQPKKHETLNVVIPWSRERFQFTSKQNTLPAHGNIMLGKEKFRLERANSWGVLDFGRGIWKYNTAWNWGAFSTRIPGLDGRGRPSSKPEHSRTLGLNIGDKWTDGTGMTENGICLDGTLSKIGEEIRFSYDARDFMKPWRIGSKSQRVHLRFVPFYERVAKAKTGVLSSEVHQMFGRYSGVVVPDTGERVEIADVFGWIEEHRARW